MVTLIKLASHPKVGVKIHSQGDVILRITLFLSSEFVLHSPSNAAISSLVAWLKQYAQRKWTPFPVPLAKTSFAQKAATYLQRVPMGQLISYQELARAIDSPKAARAIGNFCRHNLFPLLIPCHRVIPSCGGLGSFTPDPEIKYQLLQFEGSLSL